MTPELVDAQREELLEVAAKIERRRRVSDARVILAVVLVNLLVMVALALGALNRLSTLIEDVEEQGRRAELAANADRAEALAQAEANASLIRGIEGRLVERQDVLELRAEITRLRKATQALVRRLDRPVVVRGVVVGGDASGGG